MIESIFERMEKGKGISIQEDQNMVDPLNYVLLSGMDTVENKLIQSSSKMSFEDYVLKSVGVKVGGRITGRIENNTLSAEIAEYNRLDNIVADRCLLEFWSLNSIKFPKLKIVSENILSIPSTEVSVERTFSVMKFILNDQRMSIKDNLLEELLMVIINKDFWV